MEIPSFATKKELFDFLVANKSTIIAAKKEQVKYADSVGMVLPIDGGMTEKAKPEGNTLKVLAVINTTNLMDSHKDVHLPGIWNKSLQENKNIMMLQEHQMKFAAIIAKGDDVKASTKTMTWRELGFGLEGKTEALIFEATLKADKNPYMFNMYKNGDVDNHSVGMRYVKIMLAINDKSYVAEHEVWEKYYPEIANKEAADESGYFWAVKEAKVIEGSAVPIGSNWATPTLSVETKEPEQSTSKQIEPTVSVTQFRELLSQQLKTI